MPTIVTVMFGPNFITDQCPGESNTILKMFNYFGLKWVTIGRHLSVRSESYIEDQWRSCFN